MEQCSGTRAFYNQDTWQPFSLNLALYVCLPSSFFCDIFVKGAAIQLTLSILYLKMLPLISVTVELTTRTLILTHASLAHASLATSIIFAYIYSASPYVFSFLPILCHSAF